MFSKRGGDFYREYTPLNSFVVCCFLRESVQSNDRYTCIVPVLEMEYNSFNKSFIIHN